MNSTNTSNSLKQFGVEIDAKTPSGDEYVVRYLVLAADEPAAVARAMALVRARAEQVLAADGVSFGDLVFTVKTVVAMPEGFRLAVEGPPAGTTPDDLT